MTLTERSAIEWQCQQLVLKFIAHGDRQEWVAMCELLTEDASFARPTDPDRPIEGRANIRLAFESRPTDRITRHICTNIIVAAISPTRATGTQYALLFTGNAANSGAAGVVAYQRQLVGEFEDDYVLTDGGWRIASRKGRVIFSTG